MLAGLAVLTKQTFFAAAVAGTLWLGRSTASAIELRAVVALTVGLPALWLEASTRAFLSNTIVANISPFTTSVLWDLGREFVAQGRCPSAGGAYVAVARPVDDAETAFC